MRAAKVRVREAHPRDLGGIAEVEAASYSLPWSPDSLRSFIAREGTLFLIAEVNSEHLSAAPAIVGHGILRWAGGEGEVANLAVAPAWRERGVGRSLLDALLAYAAALRLASVFLEVRESNTPALRLYSRRGFRQVGVREQYYDWPREDARILRLDLPEPEPGSGPPPRSGPPPGSSELP